MEIKSDHQAFGNGKTTERALPRGMSGTFSMFGIIFGAGVGLQHVLMLTGAVRSESKPAWAALVGLLAVVVVLAGGWLSGWRRFFSSIRFAVSGIVSVTLLSVLGTLILQNQPESVLGVAYGPTVLSAIQSLFLDDIFHSFGFAAVTGMAAGGLALVTVRRRRWSARSAGSVAAHLGILLVLAGAAVGMVWGIRGYINLNEGQSADHFVASLPEGKTARVPLGFMIRLDDFQLEYYEPEYRLFLYEPDGRRQELLAVSDPGEAEALQKYGVGVIDYWPNYSEEIIVEVIGPNENPKTITKGDRVLPALSLRSASTPDEQLWVFDDSDFNRGDQDTFRGKLVFFWNQERAERFVSALSSGTSESTHILLAGEREIFVRVGQSYEIEDLGIRVKVLRMFQDFVMDVKTREPRNRSDQPVNPAIEISVEDRRGAHLGKQWLFAKFPSFHGDAKKPELDKLGYRYLAKKSNQHLRMVVVGREAEIWHLEKGRLISKDKLETGKRLTSIGKSLSILAVHPMVRRRVRGMTLSDRAENPVVRVRLQGRDTPIMLRPKKPVRFASGKLLVLAPKVEDNIRDYLSTVSVLEHGKLVLSRTVEVNYPLGYRGYSIYQSNYRREDPTFSGFLVVRDPGLWLVFLGLMLNSTGVVLVLFLPPVIRRHRKKRQATVGSEAGDNGYSIGSLS